MAKLEVRLVGNFDHIIQDIQDKILSASMSANLEDRSDFIIGSNRCAVRVFERYSYLGQNRVSMNVTLLQVEEKILLSAISSGGSQAVFFKMNTFGEEAFLDTLRPILKKYDSHAI